MSLATDSLVMHVPTYEAEECVELCRAVIFHAPLVRPTTPGGKPMSVRVSAAGSVGWVGDGAYRYSHTQASGKAWPTLPALWRDIATKAAGPHDWDCAIINWYDQDASLGWHRDLSEQDKSLPIVTISIGDACSWAMRLEEDGVLGPISRTRLDSGAVTVLADRTRLALHTVENIIPSPLFNPLKSPGRLSITVRVAT